MSDGSISQNEIDALLSGVDMGGMDSAAGSSSAGGVLTSAQQEALQKLFNNNAGALSENVHAMTGKESSVSNPVLEVVDREAFLGRVPDMVVSSAVDFGGSIGGQHLFVFPVDFAQKLVALVNNEEDAELDDMALSVISETVSNYTAKEIDAFDAEGIKGVTTTPAVSQQSPKAMMDVPDDCALIHYSVTIDDTVFDLWEMLAKEAAVKIADTLAGSSASQNGAQEMKSDQSDVLGAMNASMGGAMAQQPMNTGMQSMGSAQGGMVMPGMNPNVQSIQFPPLQNGVTSSEQGNIGLIMDVYMEMTVELGRTRKMIKEILSMGEGHIIELDKLAGEPVDILVNHKPIAKGEVVVIDENFGVRVTEILSPAERITDA